MEETNMKSFNPSKAPKRAQAKNRKPNDFVYLLLCFGGAATVRYFAMNSKYQKLIADHLEISTPLSSWKRVKEGAYLLSLGVDPYDGDQVHDTPLLLLFYSTLIKMCKTWVPLVFILFDIATSLLLYFCVKHHMFCLYVKQEQEINKKLKDTKDFLIHGMDFVYPPLYVATAYLYNPYSLLSCIGLATTVFHNFILAVFLLTMVKDSTVLNCLSLAICSIMTFYPIMLVIPMFLYQWYIFENKRKAVLTVMIFIINILLITAANFYISGSYKFLTNVYQFILNVPDLEPNIGLFWYFFIEMFDHFRDLFICSFQINVTLLYLIPLSLRFRKDPLMLTASLLSLIAIFKSYPSIGDIGFVLGLLPCWAHLFDYMQQGFLVGVNFLIATALAPIVWHLWIYSRSANANFYFGVTLASAIAQIFLITDVLFAYTKRQFCLKYGRIRKINGEEAMLVLE